MNIKHRVGEMKKTRNPNENRRGKTGQCALIFSVQRWQCECNLLVGWAQGDSDHLCWDDNRENCSPWSVVPPRQARGSWSTRLISSYHYTTHCSCHWWFWLQAQVWHLGRWQHVLNNYEKPRFSLHYMWHIVIVVAASNTESETPVPGQK